MPPLTAEFVEGQYNNRALVPEHAAVMARWERDSQFVRATLPASLDVAYGPAPRHRIDLFPAARARGTLLWIHGGYWRSLDKGMFSWLAPAWVAAGINVALPTYRLCPAVRVEQIVEDVLLATNWLFENGVRHRFSMDRVVVGGHSAGGHLTAALFAAPRGKLRFDIARIAGGAPLSGIFDFAPLPLFSYNVDLRLDTAAAGRLTLLDKRPTIEAPLVIAVGGAESAEFRRQSRALAEAWRPRVRAHLELPGLNHFTCVDALCERGQPLYESTLALFLA